MNFQETGAGPIVHAEPHDICAFGEPLVCRGNSRRSTGSFSRKVYVRD